MTRIKAAAVRPLHAPLTALACLAAPLLPCATEAQSAAPEQAQAPAQGADGAPPLQPPRLIESVELVLPEGVAAPEGGGIELVLEIDAEGRVTDVQLARSLGEAADQVLREAASKLRFEPARRGDQPVAARIGFRFELAPEPAQVEPAQAAPGVAAPAAPTTPAPGPAAAAPAPEASESPPEFGATARIDRPEPGAASRVKLRGAELTAIPGTFGEPLRVVATLPGVARSPFGLGFFLVRGASFQNTGFFVDGFSVPILYHLGAGPAILSSRLVSELDFYAGGYPVSLGRFTAGIVSLRTAPPPTDRFQLELEVDLLRASGLAVVPFASGKGSVAVALRRSYFELVLPLITDDVSLSYTDYQLRLDYRFDSHLRFSLFFFGSRDALQITQPTGAGDTTGTSAAGVEYDFDQLIGSLEWKPVPVLALRWSATVGPSRIDLGSSGTGEASYSSDVRALRLGQRLEAVHAPSPLFQTTLGFDQSVFIYELQGNLPSIVELPGIPAPDFDSEPIRVEDRLSELGLAPYAEQVWRPGPFELTFGFRADHLRYGDVSTWAFDPRGVVRLKLSESVKLKAASGLFVQPPLPYQLVRDAANPRLLPNRAWQSSIGTELTLPASLEIESSLFYSHMWQITRASSRPMLDDEGRVVRSFFEDDGKGRAYGWELLLRRRVEQGLFGWLSYTLSRSERFLEGGRTVLFLFDQTHVLNLAASYAVAGFRFGARLTLTSGRPVSDLLDPEGDDALYDADEDDFDPDSGGRRVRLPTYHQLDVRIDREWKLGPIDGSVFLDVINVYNAQNSEGYEYEYDFSRRENGPALPFLPTIGVSGVLR